MARAKSKAKADSTKKVTRRRVLFSLKAPEANEVVLVGDFNRWDPKIHPMRREEDGFWKRILLIPPGTYEYKFLVDGRWEADPDNNRFAPNSYGTQNSVLEILPR